MTTTNIQELTGILRSVVLEFDKQNIDLYDVEGAVLIEECMSGRRTASPPKVEADSRFGLPIDQQTLAAIGTYIKLIAGTVATLKALGLFSHHSPVSSHQLNKLQTHWRKELQKEGLDPDTSERIAERFSSELVHRFSGKRSS